jgi:4-hydroxybenzoate polyprenyltransferase
MKKYLFAAFNALLFSNVFIALCAVAQGLVTFHLMGVKPVYPVLAMLFVSTLGLYNFCILIIKPKRPQASPYLRLRWFFWYHRLMVSITILCLLSAIVLFFLLSIPAKLLLMVLAVLALGYGLPIFKKNGRKFGLRNIPGLKPVLITLVWTLSCVLLPILEVQDTTPFHLSQTDTIILIAKRILFIAALTIPFDIRDVFHDRMFGVKTIPVAFGEKNAYLFCQLLLGGYIALLFFFRGNGFSNDFWALTLVAVLTGWLIFKPTWKNSVYYYFFCLDGVLILQYLALTLFKHF